MLVAAAVVPSAPLLIPSVAAGAAHELDELRAHCWEAIDVLQQSEPDVLVVVGGGDTAAVAYPGAKGTMRGYGDPTDVALPGQRHSALPELLGRLPAQTNLPLSLTIAAWLLQEAEVQLPLVGLIQPFSITCREAEEYGQTLSTVAPRVAVLAVGDGSAALSRRSPMYIVSGAEQWQGSVTAAFASGDRQALLALRELDGEQYGASGRGVWQTMVGGFTEHSVKASVRADLAPYGVAYLVATWVAAA
ncbi:MAG TPA: hypothetical protein VMT88_04510 [Actinomycetes bacterium]|nr:hypothetical protein [Actinomycetes bacterium]